jgi:hypothetical protein
VTEAVFDVVAEDPEVEHVAANVQQAAVQEHREDDRGEVEAPIAGVLGAYLILFPKKNVRVLFARQIVNMPAFIVLGLWIALQIFSQIGVSGGQSSGVAYLAHIGGFVAGVALIFLFGGRAKLAA